MKKFAKPLFIFTILFSFSTESFAYEPVDIIADFMESSVSEELNEDESVEAESYLETAQVYITDKRFKSADKAISKAKAIVGDRYFKMLDDVNNFLTSMRAEETRIYISAIETGSEAALNDYIREYNYSEATYYVEAKNCIKDLKLWDIALTKNTKEGYQEYLNQSEFKGFANVANERIMQFQMEEDWAMIKDGIVEAEYRNFVAKYPNSPYIDRANGVLAVYDAAHLCDQGQYIDAYQLFNKAKLYIEIPSHLQDEYELASHAEQYKNIYYSSIEEASNYLKLYPQGMYATTASNRIAVLKADNFGVEGVTYQDALSYAKDSQTRDYIDQKANEYACKLANNFANDKCYNKAYEWSKDSDTRQYVGEKAESDKRRRHHLRWHDRVTCGWEFFSDYNGDFLGAGTGLYVKFGRCTKEKSDFINFSLGAKYTYNTYIGSEESFDYFDLQGHQIAGVAQLRFNLFRWGTGRFYIGGAGEYSYTLSGDLDIEGLAVQGQLGYNSRHFDIGLYYKQFLDYEGVAVYTNDYYISYEEILDDKFRAGVQMTFYF